MVATDPEGSDDELTPAQRRRKQKQKAVDLFNEGVETTAIARTLNIHVTTARRWLKDAGLKSSKQHKEAGAKDLALNPMEEFLRPPKGEVLTRDEAEVVKAEEAEEKQQHIEEVSNSAASPADAYQSYVATKGMDLMKKGLEGMPPPKNIREAEVLDGIIRRNLGIDGKNGQGNARLSIDVAVLSGGVKPPDKVQIAIAEAQEKAQLKIAEGSVIPQAEQDAADRSK